MHSLAWLKRELPVTFQGVGAFLLMASGWVMVDAALVWAPCATLVPGAACRSCVTALAQGMVVSMLL